MKQYGRYQIVSELGRGAMGVVYQAHDPQIDRIIALKVLRDDRVTSEDFVKRFLKEAMAVGRLSHPGIVTVYDIGQDHGSVYIAMEYLEGTPLNELMESRKFSYEEIADIGSQVARALHYAHQKGIIHRDIKPPNIIITPDGQIKVTDFGIARIEDPDAHQMTQAGEILGTPVYMSPEQVKGHLVDGRSDIYSLGIILYEMVTGERPFGGSNLAAIFRSITLDQAKPPSILDTGVPQSLSALIMKSIDREPENRFPSGEELAKSLKNCLNQPAGARATRPQKSSGNVLLLVALVLILIAGGGGGYYFWTQQDQIQVEKPPVLSDEEQSVSSQEEEKVEKELVEPTEKAADAVRSSADIPLTDGSDDLLESPVIPDQKVVIQPDKIKKILSIEEVQEKQRESALSVAEELKTVPQLPKQEPSTLDDLFERPAEKPLKAEEVQANGPMDDPLQSREEQVDSKPVEMIFTVLRMKSRPPGASLYIDGDMKGRTPIDLKVPAGKYEVQLKLENYKGWKAQLDLKRGGEVPLSIRLAPEKK